ncbi:hypothetical protein [Leisingera caerulea]|uniref:hypothetical protein n=1 Tax=Leisingera caerulea TaxID=506591 RepID=UPI0021A7DB43|nr:hypothetical protein [Leisingera caerulea]UWQ84384.1 hypothetical protein K3726_04080 [Leisingera caerulea]
MPYWSLSACVFACFFAGPAFSEYRVVTWNIDGVDKTDFAIRTHAETMMKDVGGATILVVQEIVSSEQVRAISDATGLQYWAVSDFAPPPEITGSGYRSLEVAVLSSIPMERVAEWDTTGPKSYGDDFQPRVSPDTVLSTSLEPPIELGQVLPSRGFLRVDLKGNLSVYLSTRCTGSLRATKAARCRT